MTWSYSFPLPGTQDPHLKNKGAGFESLQSFFYLRKPSSSITDLWTKTSGSVLEAHDQSKGPRTSIKPMELVAPGCMSPQKSQNLGTRFRGTCQRKRAVGCTMCKRKNCQTDHPKSKRPSGVWKIIRPGLTPLQLRLTISQQQTVFVSHQENAVRSANTNQCTVVNARLSFGQHTAAANSHMISFCSLLQHL